MELNHVNERIRILRKQAGMNQHDFAEKIGCKQQDISNAETSKYKLSLDLITGILVAFPEVNIDWLLLGRGKMTKNESSEYKQHEELLKTDEPGVKLFNCPDCIEKDKRIEDLTKEVRKGEDMIEVQAKLIRSLEAAALRILVPEDGPKKQAHG